MRTALRDLAGTQAHVEARATARLDQPGGDQPVVGLHHRRAADARFTRATSDGWEPRARTQRMCLDALRETGRQLRRQAVVLSGIECHIYERASAGNGWNNCTATVLSGVLYFSA